MSDAFHTSPLRFQGIDWLPDQPAGPAGLKIKKDEILHQFPDGTQALINGPELDELLQSSHVVRKPDRKTRRELSHDTGFAAKVQAFLERVRPDRIMDRHASDLMHALSGTGEYGHFITRQGDREGMVNYKQAGSAAIALGGPLGRLDPAETFKAWIEQCDERNLTPAMIADGATAEIARKQGFKAVPIGSEALIDPTGYNELKGRNFEKARRAINRVKKNGWTVRDYQPGDWEMVKAANDEWLKKHGHHEMGFAMGHLTPEYLKDTRTELLVDKDGQLLAYINTLDLPGSNGRGIDLMRYVPGTDYYSLDALIVHAIQQAETEGKAFFDLSLSPLARLDDVADTDSRGMVKIMKAYYSRNEQAANRLLNGNPVYRAIGGVLEKMHAFYSFKGLHQYKEKYNPGWSPRYLVYPGIASLPRIMMSLSKVME